MRAFFGGESAESLSSRSDEEIAELALDAVAEDSWSNSGAVVSYGSPLAAEPAAV